VADSVPRARDALTAFAVSAGATGEQLDAIKLAVSEAATNVVVHAYEGRRPGEIRLDAELRTGELWIQVADDGNGMRPRIDTPGLGVGLALMSQVADAFAITKRASGVAEVHMRFDLAVGHMLQSERGTLAWAIEPV
jgi:serine/threonine-protein kinase RsbW